MRFTSALGGWLLAALAAALVACGGGGDDETPRSPASPAASVNIAAPSAPGDSDSQPGPTVTPTPTAAPTVVRTDPLSVARADHGAASGEDCRRPENRGRPCVELTSNPETVANGIAAIAVNSPNGAAAVAVYGRTLAGEWARWLTTQQTFLLLFLPGDVRVCADGDGLNVRELPALTARVAQLLPDNTVARVDRFVLESPAIGEARGFGWYHVVSPAEGWAHSEFLAAAAHGDCALRDAQAGATPPP